MAKRKKTKQPTGASVLKTWPKAWDPIAGTSFAMACPKGFTHRKVGLAEPSLKEHGKKRYVSACVDPSGAWSIHHIGKKGKKGLRSAGHSITHIVSGLAAETSIKSKPLAACVAAELGRLVGKAGAIAGDVDGAQVMAAVKKAADKADPRLKVARPPAGEAMTPIHMLAQKCYTWVEDEVGVLHRKDTLTADGKAILKALGKKPKAKKAKKIVKRRGEK